MNKAFNETLTTFITPVEIIGYFVFPYDLKYAEKIGVSASINKNDPIIHKYFVEYSMILDATSSACNKALVPKKH